MKIDNQEAGIMKRNMHILISLSVLITILKASDPYYYYSNYRDMGGYLSYNIYGIDLKTGQKDLVIHAEDNIGYPFVLSDHSKIIFRCRNWICVYNHQSG